MSFLLRWNPFTRVPFVVIICSISFAISLISMLFIRIGLLYILSVAGKRLASDISAGNHFCMSGIRFSGCSVPSASHTFMLGSHLPINANEKIELLIACAVFIVLLDILSVMGTRPGIFPPYGTMSGGYDTALGRPGRPLSYVVLFLDSKQSALTSPGI